MLSVFYIGTIIPFITNTVRARFQIAFHEAVMYSLLAVIIFAGYGVCIRIANDLHNRFKNAGRTATIAVCLFFMAPMIIGAIYSKTGPRTNTDVYQSPGFESAPAVPNIILIVIDTLRADRLSMYNDVKTSPNMLAFSKDSVVFNRCIAPSPWTLPSHASLFTGVYAAEHECVYQNSKLSDSFKTLTEDIKNHHYTTAAIVANYGFLNPRYKLDQGFDLYDCKSSFGKILNNPFRPIIFTFFYYSYMYTKSLKSYRCPTT